jgi:hypothetical protein
LLFSVILAASFTYCYYSKYCGSKTDAVESDAEQELEDLHAVVDDFSLQASINVQQPDLILTASTAFTASIDVDEEEEAAEQHLSSALFPRHWKDHLKNDRRSDQDHRLKLDRRSDQDHPF